MKKNILFVCFLLISALALSGCYKHVPIETPTVTTPQMHKLTDVRQAILEACPMTGWAPRDLGNNTIEATLFIRTHVAVVNITYSTSGYTIRYKNSSHLNADGTKIHSSYNRWVQNLSNNINAKLASKPTI